MPQLLHTQNVITKDGELSVHLVLELNINVNASGGVTVDAKEVPKEDSPEWIVPAFKPAPKIKFGKSEGEK